MSKSPSNVRLLPALMVTMAVVLTLRAAAAAEALDAEANEEAAEPEAEPAPPASNSALPEAAANEPEAAAAPQRDDFASAAGLSAEELAVLQSLGARRSALEARERALEDRSALLDAAEQRIEQRIAELKKVEASIESLIDKIDAEEEARVAGLVNVYSRMRAKDAAAIFNALEPEVLLAVARRMKEPALAEIMGLMQPVAARRLTEALAAVTKLPDEAKPKLAAADAAAPSP